jgi:uncharacterized membrane protein
MKGYRTIIVNILMLLASLGAIYGFEITAEQIDAVATGIVSIFAVVNVILRAITTGPIGSKE